MKKIYLFSLALTLLTINNTSAQILNTGDVVIIGYGVDISVTPSTDEFSWLPLVNLDAGTKLYFTDAGYNAIDNKFMGAGLNDEILIRYIVPAGGLVAGTVMTLTEATIPADYTVVNGTQFGTDYNSLLTLANSGDQIFVFQSTDDESSPTTFGTVNLNPLFMVTGSSLSFTALNSTTATITPVSNIHNVTNLPPGLTDAVNAVAVGTGPLEADESDNARYQGITSGTRDEILFAVSQLSNWSRYDAAFGNDIDFGTVASGWSANGATTYSIGLSVGSHNFADQLLIAPNPVKGVLQLSNLSGKKIEMMRVSNATGQVIQSYDGFYNTIDLSALAAGTYFLQLKAADASAIKRIIVE